MKIGRNVIVTAMITFCFTATLFMMIPLEAANQPYNPWADINDDGKIGLVDLVMLANSYGTNGTPLAKAGLLFDSGWLNTTDRRGQFFDITHNLNIVDWSNPSILIDLSGKMNPDGNLIREANARGTTVWNLTFGGPLLDVGMGIIQTSDGGFVIAACNGTSWPAEDWDIMLIKLDASGQQQWNTTFGGPGYDMIYPADLIQTSDGGYALAGYNDYYGPGDMWLIKTDASGVEQWNKTYGTPGTLEGAVQVIQTSDGGYALAGQTGAFYSYSTPYLVKTDADGNVQWTQTYPSGGTWSSFWGVIQRGDGGYMLVGVKDWLRVWLIKTDSTGNMLWDATFEGSGDEEPRSFIKTADGGYAIAGYTTSYGAGGNDGWLIKTDADGNAQWNMTWGGPYNDCFNGIAQTSDGGFVLTGECSFTGDASSGDTMLVKTDSNGRVEWSRTYGGSSADEMRGLLLASDGGVVMVGETSSFGAGDRDVWLLKTSLETGLEQVDAAANTLTLYRGQNDPYWNYIRVQIWLRKTP